MKYCPNCNNIDYDDKDLFCLKCGKGLYDKPIYKQNPSEESVKEKENKQTIRYFTILLVSIIFFIFSAYLWSSFGFNSLLFLFPCFIFYVFAVAKLFTYELKPEEKGEGSYIKWLKKHTYLIFNDKK